MIWGRQLSGFCFALGFGLWFLLMNNWVIIRVQNDLTDCVSGRLGSQACPRTLSLQCGGASGWYDSAINPDWNFKIVRLKGTPEQWSFICWRWNRLTREPIKQRKLSFLICQIRSVARPPLPSIPPDGSGVFSIWLSVLLNLFLFLRLAVMYPRQTSNCHGGKNDLGLLILLFSPAES